jgi:hypothetical protein
MPVKFRKPSFEYFPPEKYPELMEREMVLHQAIHATAREIAGLLNFQRHEIVTHAVPEVLARLLDKTDPGASIIAAQTYLESRGYRVTKE